MTKVAESESDSDSEDARPAPQEKVASDSGVLGQKTRVVPSPKGDKSDSSDSESSDDATVVLSPSKSKPLVSEKPSAQSDNSVPDQVDESVEVASMPPVKRDQLEVSSRAGPMTKVEEMESD